MEDVHPLVRLMRNVRIGLDYSLIELLGSGSYGKVYKGHDHKNGNTVAIKMEHHTVDPSLLEEEVIVYESLVGVRGFPRVYWHGQRHDFNCLVMELLGPNLEDLMRYCGGRFSLKTTLMLADQLLHRFEHLHRQGYLHRDVKPDNFLLGTGANGNVVYMTDLGLQTSRIPCYYDIAQSSNVTRVPRLLGTCRYASVRGHLGVVQGPGDDLEALGYMLIYFRNGCLPWQGLLDQPKEAKYRKVLQIKQATSVDTLCKGLPIAFNAYMQHIRTLVPADTPDYDMLRRLFSTLAKEEGFVTDEVFDWTILEYERLSS